MAFAAETHTVWRVFGAQTSCALGSISYPV